MVQPFNPEIFGLPDPPGVTTPAQRGAMFTQLGLTPLVGLVEVVPETGVQLESQLTPFPREEGTTAVSHRVLRPVRLRVVVELGLANDIAQVRAVWQRLTDLWESGEIMEVVTPKATYPNMAIQRVTENTRGEYWNAMSAVVTLQEAQVVTVDQPTIPTSGIAAHSRQGTQNDSTQPHIPPEYFEAPTQIAEIAQQRAEGDSRVRPPERVDLRAVAPRFGMTWSGKQTIQFNYSGARCELELQYGALFSPVWTFNWTVNGIRQLTHRRVSVGVPLLDNTSPFQLMVVPRGELGLNTELGENAFNETHSVILMNLPEVQRLGL